VHCRPFTSGPGLLEAITMFQVHVLLSPVQVDSIHLVWVEMSRAACTMWWMYQVHVYLCGLGLSDIVQATLHRCTRYIYALWTWSFWLCPGHPIQTYQVHLCLVDLVCLTLSRLPYIYVPGTSMHCGLGLSDIVQVTLHRPTRYIYALWTWSVWHCPGHPI
jgi:hypothetical protein